MFLIQSYIPSPRKSNQAGNSNFDPCFATVIAFTNIDAPVLSIKMSNCHVLVLELCQAILILP